VQTSIRVFKFEESAMPFGIGPMEMLVVGVVALLLFGKKLPEVARGLGKSITEFKRGLRDVGAE
jgi:sec-independent protein translocase protein TatA